jgi:hypothetical protein
MSEDLLTEIIIEHNRLFPNQSEGFGVAVPADINATLSEIDAPDGFWADLFEFQFESGNTLRIAHANEDVTWDGETWTAHTIEPGDQDGGADTWTVKVSIVDGAFEEEIDGDSEGVIAGTALYYHVHTGVSGAGREREFQILAATPGDNWIEFELGVAETFADLFPALLYSSDECQYKPHHTDICPYANSSSCDRKLFTCEALGKIGKFFGQPGIQGAVWRE